MNGQRTRPRRILVVLPNWLGDLIMAGPLLDLLHDARDARGRAPALVASVRRRWAPLLSRDPRLEGLIPYERTGQHAGVVGIIGLARAWRRAAADAVLLCPPSLRTGIAARLAGIPRRVGAAGDGRGPLLTRAVPPVKPRGRLHHGEELVRLGRFLLDHLDLQAASATGARPPLPGLHALPPMPAGDGPPLWVVAPGATYGPAKTWPAGRLAEFLALAVGQEGRRIVLIGDRSAAAAIDGLKAATAHLGWRCDLPGPAGIVDMIGATTIMDLAALLRSAQAFLGNDSGPMHLAAALGVPTLGIFGSSSAAWTGPRGPRARALVAAGFPCQPCFRQRCNQPRFCLETIDGASVLRELLALIDMPTPEVRA